MISTDFCTRSQRGFSMIELMAVVTIIGILAVIAIPNYSAYIQRSRITEATSRLADFRVKMEQYFLDNRTYAGAGTACGIPNPTATPADNFTLTCTAPTATTYDIKVVGVAGRMDNFEYHVAQDGKKSTTGAPAGWALSAACWVIKKDGTCI